MWSKIVSISLRSVDMIFLGLTIHYAYLLTIWHLYNMAADSGSTYSNSYTPQKLARTYTCTQINAMIWSDGRTVLLGEWNLTIRKAREMRIINLIKFWWLIYIIHQNFRRYGGGFTADCMILYGDCLLNENSSVSPKKFNYNTHYK